MNTRIFQILSALTFLLLARLGMASEFSGHYTDVQIREIRACSSKEFLVQKPVPSKPLKFSFEFIGCAQRKGGVQKLRELVEESIKIGTKCLSKLGNDRAQDAKNLLHLATLVSRPIKVKCSNPGDHLGTDKWGQAYIANISEGHQALNCSVDNFPTISLGKNSQLWTDDEFLKNFPVFRTGGRGIFFHEAIHLLGYLHGQGTSDLVRDIQTCCFPTEGQKTNDACSRSKNFIW